MFIIALTLSLLAGPTPDCTAQGTCCCALADGTQCCGRAGNCGSGIIPGCRCAARP